MAIEDITRQLEGLDLAKMREEALKDVRSGKKTRRQSGVRLLRAVDGLQRAGAQPKDLVITKVPVLPAAFRPYTTAGSTFIPGDANELYSDLIKATQIHAENKALFGPSGVKGIESYIRKAVKATYGFEDSPNPKIAGRKVSGLLTKILGSNPKTSWVASKLLAKPQDFVGRGVISPDPELGMDEIGIPEDMAWDIFNPHVRRALAAQGIPLSRALRLIQDREPLAKTALDTYMADNPVVYSRAPAWHKHSVLGSYAMIKEGDNIKISPYTTAGLGADFDGDTCAVHAPVLPEAISDTKEKLMPSKMLFSIRSRDATLPVPKHEMVLGVCAAQLNPSEVIHSFGSKEEALQAIKAGQVKLQDRVVVPDA